MKKFSTTSKQETHSMTHGATVPFEYDQVTPWIWVGTNRCCTTHFEEALLRRRIKADISLEAERPDAPFGVISYLWIPVKDHQAPTLPQFWVGVHALESLIRHKVRVYVHCKNGHGRAPTLVAAYHIYKGKEVAAAVRLVERARRGSHINAAQRSALSNFARSLKNHH